MRQFLLSLPVLRDPIWRGRILAVPREVVWNLKRARRWISSESPKSIEDIESFTLPGCNVFFGYYDLTPSNADGTKVLAHAVPRPTKPLKRARPATIGYFLPDEKRRFVELGKTTAWCWQMGARLRWLPGSEDALIVYSSTHAGGHGSSIVDAATGRCVRNLAAALYEITPDGEVGLTLDFARLGRLRPGYGYVDLPSRTLAQAAPNHSGIWRIDMRSGKRDLIIGLADIANWSDDGAGEKTGHHYFNHVSVAPNGKRFIFFHIAVKDSGPIARWEARLFSAGIDGSNLQLVADDANPSHYCWADDSKLLVTMVKRDGSGAEYRIFDLEQGTDSTLSWFPKEDGHPSFSPDGRFLLNDTYPDSFGEQTLEAFDLSNGQRIDLGHYGVSPSLQGELRCDLHPRWSPDGEWIYFDSTHQGRRMLFRIPFDHTDLAPENV